jgi:ADP-heptose:LPS heptosyltransferase
MRKLAPLHLLLYLTHLRQRRPKGATFKKCAIYKPDNLGDVVLSLGAIRHITEILGEENCAIVCKANAAELLRREFPSLEIVVAVESRLVSESRLWNAIRKLKQLRKNPVFRDGVDLMVSLRHHRSMHLDMLLAAIPAKITVGAPSSPWSDFEGELTNSRLCFDKTAVVKNEFECRELAWHASVLSCALDAVVKPDEILSHLERASQKPDANQKLVIAPFAGERIREIGVVQLREILHAIQDQCNIEVVMVSSPADQQRSEEMAANLREDGLLHISTLCTKTLEELIQILSNATVVLTADSSPAHLATALNLPMVALIGGGHPGWFGYWKRSEKQTWLDNRVPCYGCDWKCIFNEPLCLTEIPAKRIAEEIIRRLPVTTGGAEKHN